MCRNDQDRPAHADPLRNYPYEVQERAAIYQYEAGMSRDEAEKKAVEEYGLQLGTNATQGDWQ